MTEIFAHRGLHTRELENTVPAFLEARAVGADGVELDVRRTKDGALVVHHDAAIESLGAIADLECRSLPVHVATLAEAMTACEGLRVNVEIKNDPTEASYDNTGALAGQVLANFADAGWLDRVVISSFDLATCEAVRLLDATTAVGWLLDWRRDAGPCIDAALEAGLSAIHPFFQRVDASVVERAHQRGLAVNVWTVNFVEEMRRLLELEVDTLITDDPALVLRDRRVGLSSRLTRRRFHLGLAPMNVVVCVKQIPDPAAPQSLDDGTFNLNRSGKLILDEADTYGVEMALQLVDTAGTGEVTVVSMGSAADIAGIRNALAMGAAKAIIVSDDALRGTDALGTAKVLAAAIRRVSPDLVLCATESSDGYTGTTRVQIAELLGLPSITFAKSVAIDGATIKVSRQTEEGFDEVTAPLPAVVTVTAGVVEPRYASFKGIMAAKSKPVEELTASDLGLVADVGPNGARQKIVAVDAAESRQSGEKVVDEGDGAERIVSFLESIKVL